MKVDTFKFPGKAVSSVWIERMERERLEPGLPPWITYRFVLWLPVPNEGTSWCWTCREGSDELESALENAEKEMQAKKEFIFNFHQLDPEAVIADLKTAFAECKRHQTLQKLKKTKGGKIS